MKINLVKYKLILILIIILSIVSNVTYASSSLFQMESQTLSSWAREDVEKAIEIGLITEKVQGSYQKAINREEFGELALELYEFLVGEEVYFEGENPFIDTDNPNIIAANKLGIIQGYGNGLFLPNNNITREELAVMLYRTLKIAKPKFDYSQGNEYYFNDSYLISSWAKDAINYLYATEIMNGVGDNKFNPSGLTTREEAIVTVKRIYDKVLETERERRNALAVSRSGLNTIRSAENSQITKLKNLIPQQFGKPYVWGAAGPNSFDCSGLVYYIYKNIGITLPRTSREQATVGTYVAKKDLQYGDLVFFARNGKTINHVGIYVGNGNFVHAPQSGDVVRISTLLSGYYSRSYYTARRVIH
ncbi:MAG TPA: NlpC/P60 family protein [Tissierellaceae bacterium]